MKDDQKFKPLKERIRHLKDKHLNNGKWPDHINFAIGVLKACDVDEVPLTLGQFIECNENDQPLGEPERPKGQMMHNPQWHTWHDKIKEYDTAQSNLLFKGWALKSPFTGQSVIEIINDETFFCYDFDDDTFYSDEPGFERLFKTMQHIAYLNLTLAARGIKDLL